LWAIPHANPELNFTGKMLWIRIRGRHWAFVPATFRLFIAACEQIAQKKLR
jgi:hypothetical protein